MSSSKETIKTKIWLEEPEEDNPFAAKTCYCSGYDVYGDLLGKVSWIQYLYLLFKLELPDARQEKLLETIAVAIAHPGIRDYAVRAAMNGGVCGSTRASALIASLAVGAGNLNGGREVCEMIRLWQSLKRNLDSWLDYIDNPPEEERTDVWFSMEHIPGFDPNGASCAEPVRQTLDKLEAIGLGENLSWLKHNQARLEERVGYPLSMAGVIATGFADLQFNEGEGEILYLMLRLPGAAAQALEQEKVGWKNFPFFANDIKPLADDDYQELMVKLRRRK